MISPPHRPWAGEGRAGTPAETPIADPIIGLADHRSELKVTWDSWRTVSTSEPGELVEPHEH